MWTFCSCNWADANLSPFTLTFANNVLFCRAITELTEELKIKSEEGDAYISEIEVWIFSLGSLLHYLCRGYWSQDRSVDKCGHCLCLLACSYASKLFTDRNHFACQTIGQAYEDMQTQNQRLLQQITERDDYNSQVSGSCLHFCTSCLYVVGLPAYVWTSKCVMYYSASVYEMGGLLAPAWYGIDGQCR